jgi:hypothetical protein
MMKVQSLFHFMQESRHHFDEKGILRDQKISILHHYDKKDICASIETKAPLSVLHLRILIGFFSG